MLPTTQWIALHFPTPRRVSKVVLYPAPEGFPLDFAIQIWDGKRWIDRVTKTWYPPPGATPQTFSWSTPDATTRVRVVGTRLPLSKGKFYLRLAEIETAEQWADTQPWHHVRDGITPRRVLTSGWSLFIVYAYPGYLRADGVDQLFEARHELSDTTSVLMTLVWRLVGLSSTAPPACSLYRACCF